MYSILERLENIERKIDAATQPSYRGVGIKYSAQASMKYEVSGKQYDFTSMDVLKDILKVEKELKILLFKFVPETTAEDSFGDGELRHVIHSANVEVEEEVLKMMQPTIQPQNEQRKLMGTVIGVSITEDYYTPAVLKKKPKTVKYPQPRVFVKWFERY